MRRAPVFVVAGLTAVVIALLWSNCSGDSALDGAQPETAPAAPEQTTVPRSVPRVRGDAAPAPARASASAQAPPSTTASPTPAFPLQPVPPRDLTVFVSDEGGAPVAGLWTYVDKDETGKRGQGRTDDHGAVRFRAAAGPRSIDVAEKIVPGRAFLPVGEVTVGETESEVRIRLREGQTIEGRVLDASDAPVDPVNVCVIGRDGFGNEIRTDTDGRFRISVPAGSVCDLRIGWIGHAVPGRDTPDWLPNDNFEGSLECVRAGTSGVLLRCRRIQFDRALSVVVVDPDGSPLSGAQVVLVLCTLVKSQYVKGGETDADGRCRFEGLPDRQLSANAGSSGATPRDVHAHSRPVPVLPEGQEIVVQLRRAHAVNVAIVDATGAAVARAGVVVRARGPNREGTAAHSDANGRVVLRVPADTPGLWRVSTTPDAPVRGEADVTVPTDTELRLVVEPR